MSGSEVIEPCPISAPAVRMVTVPSGAMRTQALIAFASVMLAAWTADSVSRCRPSAPATIANDSAPVLFRNSRRSMSGLLRSALDRGDDALVGAAAADVAVHVADDLLAR